MVKSNATHMRIALQTNDHGRSAIVLAHCRHIFIAIEDRVFLSFFLIFIIRDCDSRCYARAYDVCVLTL